jgi:hypothetical protein
MRFGDMVRIKVLTGIVACILQNHVLQGLCALVPYVKATGKHCIQPVIDQLPLSTIIAYYRRMLGCQDAAIPKVATELVRLLVFCHSDQRDLSGADAATVQAIIAKAVATAQLWRQLGDTAWCAFLSAVEVQLCTPECDVPQSSEQVIAVSDETQLRNTATERVRLAIAVLTS